MTTAHRKEAAWNALFVAAVLFIAFAAWLAFLKPPEAKPENRRLASVRLATQLAEADAIKARKAIEMRASKGTLDAIASGTLGRLTILAEKQDLTLSSFRAERPNELDRLTEVPFVAVVDGAFPNVMAFLAKIETPDSKLAVEMLQMQGSESNPGGVTATLSLVGYLAKEDS